MANTQMLKYCRSTHIFRLHWTAAGSLIDKHGSENFSAELQNFLTSKILIAYCESEVEKCDQAGRHVLLEKPSCHTFAY